MRARLAALALLLVAAPLAAQEPDTVIVIRRGLISRPQRDLAREAVRHFNASEVRLYGPTSIQRRDVFSGDVGALNGPLTVDGEIRGRLVAINADVELRAGARVLGDLFVVGGTLDQDPDARVDGNVQVHSTRLDIRRVGNEIRLGEEETRAVRSSPRGRRYRPQPRSRASITFNTDGTYNRVEGLPYKGGIRIDWWGENSGRLDAQLIGRTAGDFGGTSQEDLGYRVGGRMGFGNRTFELGAWAYDVVAPVEAWQLTDLEVGVASLFFRRDFRDYFYKRGVSGSVTLRASRLSLTGEVARDDERSALARDPWTPFRRNQLWRPNPPVDEGQFLRFTGRLEFDSRGSQKHGSGWYLKGEWERGQSDSVLFAPAPAAVRPAPPAGRFTYDRVFVDARRYQAIGWNGGLRLRAVAGGTAGLGVDGPLPLQRRLSLGGPDPMPGFAFRELSCNSPGGDPALPALCDRIALLQAEYRGGLSFGLFDLDRWGHSADHQARRFPGIRDGDFWFDEPQFVLMANAGAAWIHPNRPDRFEVDVGAGLEFGSVGVYAARALSLDAPIRFSLRLYHRF